MPSYALAQDLTDVRLPLDSIYLDPNNPRFVGPDWTYVTEEDTTKEAVQDEVRLRLVRDFEVEKLKMNMEVNGFLPIDRIIVREFSPSQYVVLEGNRRICAAKLIVQAAHGGIPLEPDVLQTFEEIPCLQYVGGEEDAAWIFQGLRHITGISDWSSYNKAKLLVEQMEEDNLSLTQVGKRFGLTPHGAGQWVRGYFAFKQAREESDFINEVDERSYPYFQEIFSRSSAAVREWMQWNDRDHRFENAINFNEFVGWLYPRPESPEDGAGAQPKADWDRRIIRRQDDIRQIAYLLKEDKEAFEEFRRSTDLERSYSTALAKKYREAAEEAYDPSEALFTALDACAKALDNIPYKVVRDTDSRNRLTDYLDRIERLSAQLRQPVTHD